MSLSHEHAFPLDPSLYGLSTAEAAFYKERTGIASDEDLKNHILKIQEESYQVCPYPCIRIFDFIRLKISLHPAYPNFLEVGKKGGIYLDIGCCFGNDIHKAISDGFPKDNIIGSDILREFWDIGYRLFKTNSDDFPVPFVGGDIFTDAVLDMKSEGGIEASGPLSLSGIQSLTPLKGQVSAIHAAALFHLFSEDAQTTLALRLASLLSPEKGSIIFGSHVSRPEKGFRTEAVGQGALADKMFCHSDRSWIDLWDGQIFPKGIVRVEVKLEEVDRRDLKPKEGVTNYMMIWSIVRL